MTRYDVVIYGASGFTGKYIVKRLLENPEFAGVSFAIAGRSESKLRKVLSDVSDTTGLNARDTPIIIADNSDEQSLVEMAKQANVIINAVGPYRLYGEAVVKAAVENGASHVDISGEPAFLEKMQMLYSETAKENNVYIVGACGWDSIPADLGVNFLKKNFGGDLNHIESFVQVVSGPAGYAINSGTYQTLVLAMASTVTDGLGKMRRTIMREKIPKSPYKPAIYGPLWKAKEPELQGWALPFLGSDKSVVNRSQYYQYTEEKKRPVAIETYILVSSFFRAFLLTVWFGLIAMCAQWSVTRKILLKYPDQCSANMFKAAGPTEEQIKQTSFTYWFYGYGWADSKNVDEQHEERPTKKVVASCKGPDLGYLSTSGCVLSSALTLLKDKENLPKHGGVYTTAAAFGDSKIYEYLEWYGITFQLENN